MRWDRLFTDLEAQLAAAEDAEDAGEAAERGRAEAGRLPLADRLRAAVGLPLTVAVLGQPAVSGVLRSCGQGWVLLELDGRPGGEPQELLVVATAVLWVLGLPSAGAPAGSRVEARLGLGAALRALARDRRPVRLTLVDGSVLHGTLDRVGADAVDLARHEPGEARRRGTVRGHVAVPWEAIASVRS